MAEKRPVNLSIYSVRGKLVRVLADRGLDAGSHDETWDGRDETGRPAAPVVYFCRLVAGDESLSMKIILMR